MQSTPPDPAGAAHPERDTGRVPTDDGLELHYERRRRAGPVLVVPSASWLARDMDPLAPSHTTVFYDIRGRGRSSAIFDEDLLGLEKDVADLESLRRALGIERMSLLGWSYHGAIVARYARAHPERVERLVLVGPTAPAEDPWWMEFLERFGQRVKVDWLRELDDLRRQGLKDKDPARWSRTVHRVFFRAYVVDPAVLERMRSDPSVEPNLDADRVNDQGRRVLEKLGDYDWREDFGDVRVPALLLHGLEDPVAPGGTEEWHRILAGSRLELWEGVAHMPWLEVPGRFFSTVNAFLAEDPAAS